MKQKKHYLTLLRLSILAILSAAFFVISGSQSIEAKSKKTIRVNNEADLIKLMDDSSVGTIFFRSTTYDKVTIPANSNAKGKVLYVDAPNALIFNNASFKEIMIDRAYVFKQLTSVNKVYINSDHISSLALKNKSTIKNLIIMNYSGSEEQCFIYSVEKGSKVKNINYLYWEDDGTTELIKWDKASRTLTFYENEYETGEPIVITLTFDKYGRIKEHQKNYQAVYGWDIFFTYSSINLKTIKEYMYIDGNKTLVSESKTTDKGDTRIVNYTDYIDGTYIKSEIIIKYNDDDDIIKKEYNDNTEYFYTMEYVYDKKGRIKTNTFMDNECKQISKYTYDKNGCLTLTTMTDTDHPGETLYFKREYDKDGNNIYKEKKNFDGTVSYEKNTYDEFGGLLETVYVDENGETHVTNYGMDE